MIARTGQKDLGPNAAAAQVPNEVGGPIAEGGPPSK